MRRKIIFLIGSLNFGGAERQLVNLVKGLSPDQWEVLVLCTHEKGAFAPELESLPHVRVRSLERAAGSTPRFIWNLVAEIRDFKADLVHAYLISAHLYSLLAKPLLGNAKLILGIRSAFVDVAHYGLRTRVLYAAVARLNRLADAYVLNSNAAVDLYAAQGYDRARMHVVSNGIELERWSPDETRAGAVRETLGAGAGQKVIGIVASLEHMKDHLTFVQAAARVAAVRPEARFVAIGRDATDAAPEIKKRTAELGLNDRIRFLGNRADVADLLNGIDLVCSSSIGEGFSNSIAEAMCMQVPCVVTDVGDSARIVGKTGWVVPARNPEKMAEAMIEALSLPDAKLHDFGVRARERIAREFSVAAMVRNTEAVYRELLS